MKKNNQIIKFFGTTLLTGLFLFMAYGSGGHETTDIQSEEEIREYIKGKWSGSHLYNGYLASFRFEVTDTQIKFWQKGDIMNWNQQNGDWSIQPNEVVNYTIAPIQVDSNGNQKRVLASGQFGQMVIQSGNRTEDDDEAWFSQIQGNGEENSLDRGWKK